jgi:hypothetical protein
MSRLRRNAGTQPAKTERCFSVLSTDCFVVQVLTGRRLHADNELLSKLAKRFGQRSQFRVVARIQNAADFLLVLAQPTPQLRLADAQLLNASSTAILAATSGSTAILIKPRPFDFATGTAKPRLG